MARIDNNERGVRAVLMKDRSYVCVEPGGSVELDRDKIASVGAGLSIDGANHGVGVKLAELEPIPGSRPRLARFVPLAPVPASLAGKATRAARAPEDTFTGFLDRSVKAIADDLAAQPTDQLERLLRDERRGKSRKSLIPLIEAEIASRS
jgi:hypothetical protein